MAVAVALLMIGGEFDLSAGVMTASTSLVTALLAVHAGWNVWLALLVSLVFALAVGAFNGWLVMRTGLPSFIVTLGTFLALQGLNLGVTRLVTDTVQVSGHARCGRATPRPARLFASTFSIGRHRSSRSSIVWWIVRHGARPRGCWCAPDSATGSSRSAGPLPSARAVGVPVVRTKILLFMGTAFAGMARRLDQHPAVRAACRPTRASGWSSSTSSRR